MSPDVFKHVLLGRWRATLWRMRGARIAKKVQIGAGCRFDRPHRVLIGRRCEIESRVWFKLVQPQAMAEVGPHCFIGRDVEMDIAERVVLGSHVLIAPGVFISDHHHNIAKGTLIDSQGCSSRPVVIGDDVWIGAKAMILPGVRIADGAVVGAGAVLTKNLPENSIAVGVPAKIIRYRM